MSIPSGPFARPASQADPGLGWPVWSAVAVFVIGLVVIGLVGLSVGTGGQAQTPQPSDLVAEAGPTADEAQTPTAQQPKPPAPLGKTFLTPAGRSPIPQPGEGITNPFPAVELPSEDQADAHDQPPAPQGPVPWTDAHQYLGQTITVNGTILDTNNIGQICFLNFDPDWQDKFYIAMFNSAFELLPDPPEDHYLNKTLLITGQVTLHRGRPQIQVRDLTQIEVVE